MRQLKLIICCVFLTHLTSNFIHAQNESGHRSFPLGAMKAVDELFDSTNAMYQLQYPIIRSIPPLSTSMPYGVLISYIYLDSLLRMSTDKQLDSVIKSWRTTNDTLKTIIKALYLICDYNPIIFTQYMDEQSRYMSQQTGRIGKVEYLDTNYKPDTTAPIIYQGRYSSGLYWAEMELLSKLFNVVNPEYKQSFYSLIYSDYILRIKVIGIDSFINKNAPSVNSKDYRYNVTAQVLDTIKGKVFKSIPITALQKKEEKNRSLALNKDYPFMTFQFLKRNYMQPTIKATVDTLNDLKEEQEFVIDNGKFYMKVGQEAVVFLRHKNALMDLENDYYDLGVEPSCSYNALFIDEKNNIRDLNKFWSPNVTLNYNTWKIRIKNLINKILNMDY